MTVLSRTLPFVFVALFVANGMFRQNDGLAREEFNSPSPYPTSEQSLATSEQSLATSERSPATSERSPASVTPTKHPRRRASNSYSTSASYSRGTQVRRDESLAAAFLLFATVAESARLQRQQQEQEEQARAYYQRQRFQQASAANYGLQSATTYGRAAQPTASAYPAASNVWRSGAATSGHSNWQGQTSQNNLFGQSRGFAGQTSEFQRAQGFAGQTSEFQRAQGTTAPPYGGWSSAQPNIHGGHNYYNGSNSSATTYGNVFGGESSFDGSFSTQPNVHGGRSYYTGNGSSSNTYRNAFGGESSFDGSFRTQPNIHGGHDYYENGRLKKSTYRDASGGQRSFSN